MTPHHDTARDILSALEQRKGFRDLASLFLPETVERIVEEVASIIEASQVSQDRLSVDATRAPTGGWQPIETAPKDGRDILLWGVHRLDGPRQFVGGWHPAEGDWSDEDARTIRFDATHWTPLPSHPSTDGEGA